MKHIKIFEDWREDVESDLAFPIDYLKGVGKRGKGDSMAYRYKQLVRDRDFNGSLLKIKEMSKKGYLKYIETFGLGLDDSLFVWALKNGRIDVADFLYDIGYKITDIDKATSYMKHSVDKFGNGENADDYIYAIRNYIK